MAMNITKVGELNLSELQQIIIETIEEYRTAQLGQFEIPDVDDENTLPWDEINDLIDQYRWTPPPGAKSSLELLREDRDR